jgi:hypothetical protein
MNSKLTIVIAVAAGIVGSLTTRYVEPRVALAQAPLPPSADPPSTGAPKTSPSPPSAQTIRGQSFTFVDSRDRVIATLSVEMLPRPGEVPQGNLGLVLRDPAGRMLWTTAEGNPLHPLSENLR